MEISWTQLQSDHNHHTNTQPFYRPDDITVA